MTFTIDPDLLGLVDEVAIVMGGGGRGMGRAHAVQLAKAGCHVAVADRDPEGGNETVRQIEALGRKAKFFDLDAFNRDSVNTAVSSALSHFGKIDVAVNSVGGSVGSNPFLDVTDEAWDKTFAWSLKTTFIAGQAQALAMIECGSHGRIINVSSASGWNAADANAHLGAAKAGVIHLTKTMAVELAKWGIRVNCIIPGSHDITEGRTIEETMAELPPGAKFNPLDNAKAPVMRRLGSSWETANLSVFFASKLSNYVTGTSLLSDGGLSLTLNRPQRDGIPEAAAKLGKQPLFES